MDFLFMIVATLHITSIASKKYESSSDESSIENILYYKDCSHKAKRPPAEPLRLADPTPKAQPECVPRMCCSMSCANNCGQDSSQAANQQSQSMPLMQSIQPTPQQTLPFNRRKKTSKQMQKPIGGRRSLGIGFTREHIKSLISQDEDIKKILKDLVRVTMQKVDLIDMINARRNGNKIAHETGGQVFNINQEEDNGELEM